MQCKVEVNKTNRVTFHALCTACSSATPKYRNLAFKSCCNRILIISIIIIRNFAQEGVLD
jgi:hypothetical protein